MFDWLKKELTGIKSGLFMVAIPLKESELISLKDIRGQYQDYYSFMITIGKCKLFHESGYYQLGVHLPEKKKVRSEVDMYIIGYCEEQLLAIDDGIYCIIDRENNSVNPYKGSFEDWIKKMYFALKNKYPTKEWQEKTIVAKGFNKRELDILNLRRKIRWQYLGEKENNIARFKIENNSEGSLPFFTIGLKRKDEELFSAVWLNIKDLKPGESKEIDQQIHKGTFPLEQSVFYDLQDPFPEQKNEFWEFRK